jgi:hypothetical protein
VSLKQAFDRRLANFVHYPEEDGPPYYYDVDSVTIDLDDILSVLHPDRRRALVARGTADKQRAIESRSAKLQRRRFCVVGKPGEVRSWARRPGQSGPPSPIQLRTAAEIAATVERLRLSITNSMRFGESARMAEDAGFRREEISRELAPTQYGGFRVSHLRVAVLLAAINRAARRGDSPSIESWKQMLFGELAKK